ncbi:hypothetical protein quinque_013774 [Culex quinquefasciatus]
MLDPWEKKFINGVILGILALLGFSSYVYLPGYTRKLINAFLPATGSEHHLHLEQLQSTGQMDFGVN